MKPTYEQLQQQVSALKEKVAQLESLQALQKIDEKFRLMYETMSQGVIYQAANGDILLANPAAEKALGLSSDQLRGKTSMDPRWKMIKEDGTPVPGEEHPNMLALKTGKKVGPVIRAIFHPEQNSYVWLSITSTPLFRKGEKKPYQAYATFDDITEIKQAQDKLKKSEDSLAFALAANHLGAWELDLTTGETYRTLKHDQIFGYNELLTHWSFETFTQHVHTEDVEQVRKIFTDAIKQQKDWSFECRILRTDGKERWIWATGRHIKNEEGHYSRMAGLVQDITQQKKTHLELQHREKLLAYIIKHDPSAIAVHDNDLNYLFVSDRYLSDYRVQDPHIIGKHHYEVFPDLPQKWRKVHQRALKGEVISCEEDVYLRKDGTMDYTRWLCRPWHTSEGEIGGIILYTEVITARKQVELNHQKTARQLKLILEHAGDGIFAIDNHHKATLVNQAALKMLGYTEDDLLGKSMHRLHHHTHTDGTPYPLEKCPIHLTFQTGKQYQKDDEVFWRKDGTFFPVEYISAPIKEAGQLTGAVVSFRDVSSKIKDKNKINSLNNQLREIISTINQLAKADDIGLLQTIVANAARKLVKAQGTTFVLRENNFCHYVEEDTDTPLWKGSRFPFEKCITGWVMLNKEAAIIPDISQDPRVPLELYKKTFVKSLAIFPANLHNPPFAIGCYWSTLHTPDHEEIQLIQTLAEAANISYANITMLKNLETLVQERTHDLEMANKELEAFSYSVSHDLRAPLRAIMGFTNILTEDFARDLDDEGIRICGIIKDNAAKMSNLIDDLLDFSKLARKEITMSFIDMKTLVKTIFHELANESQRQQIHLTLSDLKPCHGDHSMIRQVITNLLSNAIKYSAKKEKPHIEVFSKNINGKTTYYFRDNGVGFDMKYKEKVFGVFQRLHSVSDFEGTGVGLAIVQRIIHRHGGTVDAKGTPGQGATFWFSLPSDNTQSASS